MYEKKDLNEKNNKIILEGERSTLEIELEDHDKYSYLVTSIKVGRTEPIPDYAIKECSNELVKKLTYLPESLELLEFYKEEKIGVITTKREELYNGVTEIIIDRNTLKVRRYDMEKHEDIAMNFDDTTLLRVANDISAVMDKRYMVKRC